MFLINRSVSLNRYTISKCSLSPVAESPENLSRRRDAIIKRELNTTGGWRAFTVQNAPVLSPWTTVINGEMVDETGQQIGEKIDKN